MGKKGYSDDTLHSSLHFPSTQGIQVVSTFDMSQQCPYLILSQCLQFWNREGGKVAAANEGDRDRSKLHDKA